MKKKSARRIKRREAKRGKKLAAITKILLVASVFLIAYLFIILTTKFWNGADKLGLVHFNGDGNVDVTVFDPVLEEMTVLTIPGVTEVSVARNYGTLRLKNVWQLGINEKLDGGLLTQTVTKNFLFPVFLWSEEDIDKPLKFVFLPGKTNIPFGDRLSIVMYSLKVGNLGKTEIDLGKSQFLRREILSDGQVGYRVAGRLSERLTIYFADNDFSEKGIKIYIKDATETSGVSEKVGEILEVMGGKVVAVDRESTANTDCEVLGKDPSIIKKVANLFSCRISKDKTDFDIEIKLGKKFAERF